MVVGKELIEHHEHSRNDASVSQAICSVLPSRFLRGVIALILQIEKQRPREAKPKKCQGGAKIPSHICMTSKPTAFPTPVLQTSDEVWSLAMALQRASHIPISLRGISGKYSGHRLFSLAWWARQKYHACLGSWKDYNCRINLVISLL